MNLLGFPIPKVPLLDRETFLLEQCRGKAVLHLGCADSPYTRERVESKTLLHVKLAQEAKCIVGIDLDRGAVSHLQDLGVSTVKVGNAERLEEFDHQSTYEVIVAGEILEHLPNPGRCLLQAKKLLSANGVIAISVPNAFSAKSMLRVALGIELVHPEHVCYYSPATLHRLAAMHGLECQIAGFYASRAQRLHVRLLDSIVLGWARTFLPQCSEGLLALLEPSRT